MLQDVLSAFILSKTLGGVAVISNDPTVWEVAKNFGVSVIKEPSQEDVNASVEDATKTCIAWGASTILVVPSDVPLITTVDIDFIFSYRGEFQTCSFNEKGKAETTSYPPSVILVPSLDRKGTNAFLRSPPDIIPSRFGYDSFQAHIAEAEKQKTPYQVYELPSVMLDIDFPEDIRRFLSKESETFAYRELLRMGIPYRL
jgi:2-phospho-L-lactate guanylyltransferase (CobY/MobA/RfbA family)